jgi:hypothetical protein
VHRLTIDYVQENNLPEKPIRLRSPPFKPLSAFTFAPNEVRLLLVELDYCFSLTDPRKKIKTSNLLRRPLIFPRIKQRD